MREMTLKNKTYYIDSNTDMTTNTEDKIRSLYYNPESGFVGVEKLYRKLKTEGVSRKDIQKFLNKQQVYQVNKKNNKRSGSFIPKFPLQEFQIDLIYLDDSHLNQASYGLCCIDAFTKKADVELMKRRTKTTTVDAMIAVFERMGVPTMIYCDEGSEFNNSAFKRMCDELGIELVFTIRHATIVERFNRTIKEMLHKYLQSTKSKTITNILPKIVKNYNNSYHSTIEMAPNEVNEDTQHVVQINLLNNLNSNPYTKLEIGDKVRVQMKPKSFMKGYKPKFTERIYEVNGKGDGYYTTTKDNRLYLKVNLQKVEENELNPEKPDLEGTLEGHLKEMKNKPRREYEIEEVEDKRKRTLRERKPVSQLDDARYGRIKY